MQNHTNIGNNNQTAKKGVWKCTETSVSFFDPRKATGKKGNKKDMKK